MILDWLKNIFKPKQVTQIVRVSPEEIPSAIMQQIAQLQAENQQLKAELDRLKKEKEQEKEFEEIERVAEEKAKKFKKKKKRRRLILEIKNLRPLPVFYLRDNKTIDEFKYLYGFEIEESEEGYIYWRPILSSTPDARGKKFRVDTMVSGAFEEMFKENVGIVSQMFGGKVDTNFIIDKDGNAKLLPSQSTMAYIVMQSLKSSGKKKGKKEDQGDPDFIIPGPLDDVDKIAYETIIAKLRSRLSRLQSELRDLKMKQVEYENKIEDMKLSVETLKKQRDTYMATLLAVLEKVKGYTRELSKLMVGYQDTELMAILSNSLNFRLMQEIDKLKDEVQELRNIPNREIIREEMKEDMELTTNILERLLPPPTTEEKKEGEKGGGGA